MVRTQKPTGEPQQGEGQSNASGAAKEGAFRYDAVAFSAHPDDVEMAMGGTMAALTAAGKRGAIVCLTRGELGTHGTPAERQREAAAAARILGSDLYWLDFEDGGVVNDLPSRRRVVETLRELRPRIVFAPYPHARTSHLDGRSNVDHLATGSLVRDACKLARLAKVSPNQAAHSVLRVYYYMLPDDVIPTWTVDVSAHVTTLEAAIAAHASQMAIARMGDGIAEVLRVRRRAMGLRIRAAYGESFLSEDPIGGPALPLLEF